MITRRKTLRCMGLGVSGLITGLPLASLAQSGATEDNPLRIPPQDFGNEEAGLQRFRLRLQTGSREFLPGTVTPTFGINGDYLGPTLRFRRRGRVALAVSNSLSEPTTLHSHGFHLPSTEDGGPHQALASGALSAPQCGKRAYLPCRIE